MKKFKGLFLVAIICCMSFVSGANASVNQEDKYIDDYPIYKKGDLVKVTNPDTGTNKEFYVIGDYRNTYKLDECDLGSRIYETQEGYKYSVCDFVYLIEKEATFKNIKGTEVEKIDFSSDLFYRELNNSELFWGDLANTYDINYICIDNDSDITEATKLDCPSWLGYNFWLYDTEKSFDEQGVENGVLRWGVFSPSLGETQVRVAAMYENMESESYPDVKSVIEVHKSLVSKVEEPKKDATTTTNPKTGIVNPIVIGGTGITLAIILILLMKKKNLFTRI